MNSSEISHEIDKVESNVEKVARGDDDKILTGLLVRGVWEVVRQLSLLREGLDCCSRNV